MHRLLKTLLGPGLLASGLSFAALPALAKPAPEAPASGDEADDNNEPIGGESDARDVAEPEPAEPRSGKVHIKDVPGAKDSLPGKVHVVVRGDTLWDLSQSYLGTPWYWPKVWSYNPQIANPHWIYPGNQVKFFPGGDEAPSRVEVEEKTLEPADNATGDTFRAEEHHSSGVQVIGKIGYTAPRLGLVRREGFVSSRDMENVGVITEAPEQQLFLSPPDKVYMTFRHPQNAKIGDRYLLFRKDRDIYNPRTGRWAGYFTRILGTVKILGVENKRVIGRLDKAWEEIERGAEVGPFGEPFLERLTPRPNDRTASGYILGAIIPTLILGQNHYILTDLGSADGVQVGNTFDVVRQSDPSNLSAMIDSSENFDKNLPREDIATCLAVDVREKTSLCLLTRSVTDVTEGDRVVMAPPTPASASAK